MSLPLLLGGSDVQAQVTMNAMWTPRPCSIAWTDLGTTTYIQDGKTVTAYQIDSACPCSSETRTCTNTVLSGTYLYSGCTDSCGGGGGGSCFLAGTPVIMADGRIKPIEMILPGERVRGRFGEGNLVLGLDRPQLGRRPLYRLNGHHYTTDDHPYWTDKGPVAADPSTMGADWGHYHSVIVAGGRRERWMNVGLTRDVHLLRIGQRLVRPAGYDVCHNIEKLDAPPTTQLYNLVLDGSHTYFVDGYLVTGWPREDDFNYDRWEAKKLFMPPHLHMARYMPSAFRRIQTRHVSPDIVSIMRELSFTGRYATLRS